jgi:UDP-N-acetylglucosamine:LPS N-acetylglucosamine transferase
LQKKILILAGGGGHTGYAYTLAQHLTKKVDLHFLIPSGDILSKKRLDEYGKVDYLVKPRGPTTSNAYFLPKLLQSFLKSNRLVKNSFSSIISTGSNFSFPPALWGWIKGIPIVNIESPVRFTKPALTTKYLAPFSTITALQWEEQKNILDGIVVGPLLPRREVEPWNGGYILVTGGTLGHRILFDTISKSDYDKVVLQTGEFFPKEFYRKHPEWKVFDYSENFSKIMAGADVVVTHFGFTALEAASLKKPLVVVLNKELTRTVGIEDAEVFAKKINAILLSEISLGNLNEAIEEAKKRKPPELINGAEKLASLILDL